MQGNECKKLWYCSSLCTHQIFYPLIRKLKADEVKVHREGFMNTYDQVHACIAAMTRKFITDEQHFITIDDISRDLNVSRTVISRYLARMQDNKVLVRISSRPVLYYDRKTIEDELKLKMDQYDFLSKTEFMDYIRSQQESHILEDVIGSDQSLSDPVLRLRAYLKYNGTTNSMAVLWGEKGTGKKFLVESLFRYGIHTGEIESKRKLVLFNCQSSGDLSKELFDETGPISQADHGVLYLYHAESLSRKDQQRILSVAENGKLNPDDPNSGNLQVSLILGLCSDPHEALEPFMTESTFTVIRVPAYHERSAGEREELVMSFLKREERRLEKKVFITNHALSALKFYQFSNNLDGLRNAIKTTFINAEFASFSDKEKLTVGLYHLPEPLIRKNAGDGLHEGMELRSLDHAGENRLADRVLGFYEKVLHEFSRYQAGELSFGELESEARNILDQYSDYLLYEKKSVSPKIETYKSVLDSIIELVSRKHRLLVNAGTSFVLARILYRLTYMDQEIQHWEDERKEEVEELLKTAAGHYQAEYTAVYEIEDLVKTMLDISINSMNTLYLIMSLSFLNQNQDRYKTMGIIVAHGFATASSVADSVNRLTRQNILYPIDMSLDLSVDDIVDNLKKYLRSRPGVEEAIIMVDMGSLEELGSRLKNMRNIRIGIINNISTKVALAVADQIRLGKGTRETLEKVCTESAITYSLYESSKRNAIIFTTETGVITTERVLQVFKKSLPREVSLNFVTCDGSSLAREGIRCPVFQDYNVLMIAGTMNICIDSVPCFAIEDLIAFKDIDKLNEIFRQYLTEQEMWEFNNNLIKNFSLGNIVQSLTILNGQVLLDYIEAAVERMTKILRLNLTNKIRLRVYIHVSCSVERLVTKQPLVEYPELDDFVKNHREFLQTFRFAFKELADHYHISIPDSEIAYLHDYIFDDYIPKETAEIGRLFND